VNRKSLRARRFGGGPRNHNAGNSFKNQGDCVSYVATNGKNLGAITP